MTTVPNTWEVQADFDAGTYFSTQFEDDHLRLDNQDSTTESRNENFDFRLEDADGAQSVDWEYTVWDNEDNTTLASDSGTVSNLTSDHGGNLTVSSETLDIYQHPELRIELAVFVDSRQQGTTGELYFRTRDFDNVVIAEAFHDGELNTWQSDTDTHSYANELPFEESGEWISETRTIDGWVTHDELEVSAVVPTDTTLELVVDDGAGNTDRISVTDGTNTYTASGLSETDSLQIDAELTTGDTEKTPELTSFTISSTLVVPSAFAVDDSRADEVDLSWGGVENENSYDLYRSRETGTSDADYDLIEQVTDGSTALTDGGLTNGTEYFYRVRASYGAGDSALSQEVSTITTLPAPVFDALLAGDEETTSEWTKNDNSDEGDWSILRSTDGSTGDSVVAPELPDRSYVDTSLVGGQTYYYTVRRRTPDATADSGQLSATPELPGPGNLTIDEDAYDVRLVLDWTDEADSNDNYRIEESTDGGETFEHLVELDPDTERYETRDLGPNVENIGTFTYRVSSENSHTASSDERTGNIRIVEFGDTWTIALRLDGDLAQIHEQDLETSPRWRSEPNAMTSWHTSVPWSPTLEEWMRAEAWIWFDRELLLRGEFHNPRSEDGRGTTELNGVDVIKQLDRGGLEHTVSVTPGWEAIRDFVESELEDWDWTVHEPEVSMVDEQTVIQSAATDEELSNLFGDAVEPGDVPLEIDNGLKSLQSCWTREAEDHDRSSGTVILATDDEASDGRSISMGTDGGTIEFDFTTDYTIPAEEVLVQLRLIMYDVGGNALSRFNVRIDGETVVSDEGLLTYNWEWYTFDSESDGYAVSGDLEPGTHTLEIEKIADEDNETLGVDVVAPADARYEYTLDNSVHEPGGYLDGPEFHPDAIDVLGIIFEQSWNVTASNLAVVMDEIGNQQALASTNEAGAADPAFETEPNTASATLSYDDTVGTVVQPRITLSRHGQRDTATPRQGFNPQTVSEFEHAIDTDDLAVIDQFDTVGTPFEILQELHDESGMIFVPEYHVEELRADSLQPGGIAKDATWQTLDHSRDPDTRNYANSLTVFGSVDEETGERLVAEARDRNEIDDVGEVEGPAEWRDDVDSLGQLRNIARVTVSRLVSHGDLRGTEEIVPKPIRPGFGYESEALDGETVTLWAVDFGDSRGDVGTLEFREPEDFAGAFQAIQTAVRRIQGD